MRTRPLLTRKTAARFRELETALELRTGIAEGALSDILETLKMGDTSMILGGWEFDDEAAAAAEIKRLGARWASEDAQAGTTGGKEGEAA